MKDIVDRVLLDFEEDVEVFDDFLAEFTEATDELRQRATLVERRTTEAADGQEKLHEARTQAQEEVSALIQGKPVSEACRNFLQSIWADKLTFILLRNSNAAESNAWHK